MCGINGAMSFKDSEFKVTEPYISAMRDTMIHRGPDGAGSWVNPSGHVGFGHRRLAIIDLSTSAIQPMKNEDESVVITFNGEIYNHVEIRQELEALGKYKWMTDHSDTEMILRAYEEWGIQCIHKFRGMFALGIWDARTQNLWLVRDRLGIKPLYYSVHNRRVVFASEIKALLKDPNQKRVVNEEALFHYLSYLTTPAPETLFEGIFKLPPGCYLRIDLHGAIEETRYYDLLDNTEDSKNFKSEDESSKRIISELKRAVHIHKIGDVPVGVFLSGGIDSSLNVGLFAEGEKEKLKTFTIGYDKAYNSYASELPYAEMVAKKFGTDHREKILNVDDLLNFLPTMIHLQDEPIADPVCFPVYFISKEAVDNGVKVCHVGEGSDELFFGYPGWKTRLTLERLNEYPVPNFLKSAVLKGLALLGKAQGWPYEILKRAIDRLPTFWGGAEAFTDVHKRSLLSNRLKNKFKNTTSFDPLRPIWNRFNAKAKDKSHINWMSYLDLNFRLPDLLLMRVDKMSMGVSLEARVPFLDHKFVETAFSIPSEMKTKDGVLKYILKKAVRGIIPDEIIDRPKQGFGVPIYDWLFDKLGIEIQAELREFVARTDYFSPEAIEKLIASNKAAQLWYLYNFALWHKIYIEAGRTSAELKPAAVELTPEVETQFNFRTPIMKLKEMSKRNQTVERMARRIISVVPYHFRRLDRHFWNYYHFLFEFEKKSVSEAKAYQLSQLKNIVEDAYNYSSFYKRKYDRSGFHPRDLQTLEDIKKIPLLTRDEVRMNADEIVLSKYNKANLRAAHTSGTTGKAVKLYLDEKTESKEWASICYQWARVGYKPGDGRIELRGFVKEDVDYIHLPDERVLRINIVKMSDENIGRILNKIKSLNYKFIHGYPSAVFKFANIIKKTSAEIQPQAIMLASEVLYDWQLHEIDQVFKCAKIVHYGQAEKVILGAWDQERKYYFMPSYGIVEYDNETQELIGTSLINEVMPMIRYRLTDSIESFKPWDQQSTKTLFPVIDVIKGREEDNTYDEKGNVVPPALVTFPFKQLKMVEAAKLIQEDKGHFKLIFETQLPESSLALQMEVTKVIKDLKQIYGDSVRFDVVYTEKIPLNNSGKFRWIECRIHG